MFKLLVDELISYHSDQHYMALLLSMVELIFPGDSMPLLLYRSLHTGILGWIFFSGAVITRNADAILLQGININNSE